MNYLSFDVGIHNLAYCELSLEDIQQWGIININNSPQCYFKIKEQCEKVRYIRLQTIKRKVLLYCSF